MEKFTETQLGNLTTENYLMTCSSKNGLNSCDNLEEFSQVKKPVLRNAQEKVERRLPYCKWYHTMYAPLDEMLVHFEIKSRKIRKTKKSKDAMEMV